MRNYAGFGLPLDLTDADDAFRQRFWSKVDVRDPDECWPWLAYRQRQGYGQFTLRKGVFVTASRVALALTAGPIPMGSAACHTCDNPPCVNPGHLFIGTQADNVNDSVRKGRSNRSRGEAHRDARLTAADVAYIRAQDLTQRGRTTELARQFGVSLTAIKRVADRQTWRHVA